MCTTNAPEPGLKQADLPRLSILIKCLNEEEKISSCLRSILEIGLLEIAGIANVAEIILVDSLSSDRTVDIARAFRQVKIVQFSKREDIGCGAAVQLAYQWSTGEYLLLLDGDMTLAPNFLREALMLITSQTSLGAVGGIISDTRSITLDDARRLKLANSQLAYGPTHVADLPGGGLYRRAALEASGYLANRWLHACEEAELGVRLRVGGWIILRLDRTSMYHTGHDESDIDTLCRKWKSGRIAAYGVLLRGAIGKPWLPLIVQKVRFVFYAPLIHALAITLSLILREATSIRSVTAYLILLAISLLGFTAKHRSIRRGCLAAASLHLYAVGTCLGALGKVRSPDDPIPSRIIYPSSN